MNNIKLLLTFLLFKIVTFNSCLPSPGHCKQYNDGCEKDKPTKAILVATNSNVPDEDKKLPLLIIFSDPCKCK